MNECNVSTCFNYDLGKIGYCKISFTLCKYDCPIYVTHNKLNESKLNNTEGIKHDEGKLLYHLIPAECIEQLARVYTFGAKKYGEYNWLKLDQPMIRYCDALERHLIEWKKGNKEDNETGINHLAHVAWNAFALLWFDLKKK